MMQKIIKFSFIPPAKSVVVPQVLKSVLKFG